MYSRTLPSGPCLLLLFIAVAFSACHPSGKNNTASGQPTDISEHGLHGKVKRITARHYTKAAYANGKWTPLAERPDYTTIQHFNEQGNIDTARIIFLLSNGSQMEYIRIYSFTNNRKTAARRYNSRGKLLETDSIRWIDPHTYTETVTDTHGNKTYESTSWLDADFRDSRGEYLDYEGDKIRTHEKYTDILDENKLLIRADFTDLLTNRKYSILYKHSEFDANHNPVATTLLNAADSTVKDMTIRKIEYY